MTGIELLNNKGIQFIGDEQSLMEQKKTLIVAGVARGGTSLVAGSLHHLGIFGGEKSTSPVFEDVKLATAFETNDQKEAQQTIHEYNKAHNTWFFKRPSAIEYSDKLHKGCRNPIYLFIFKDIFSVSNRNSISMKSDVLRGLKKAYDDYGKILKFLSENNLNGFLLSYEKIMLNKELFIDTLIDIIGKDNVTAKQKSAALNFIEPNPKDYLNASRITRSLGRISFIEKTYVKGWAKHVHSNEPVTVELYINNILKITTLAKEFNQHALDKNVHPTGHCGYVFDLKDSPLKNGDKVSVKVKDDVIYLENSDNAFEDKKVKAALLGGSNTVTRYGISQGVSETIESTNYAIDASSSLKNIYALVQNRKEILHHDLIITESNVNDAVVISQAGVSLEMVLSNIDKLYYELNSMGVPVVALVLPIKRYDESLPSEKIIEQIANRHLENIKKYNFYFINLYTHFKNFHKDSENTRKIMPDSLHLAYSFMYNLGRNIANYFITNTVNKEEPLRQSRFYSIPANMLGEAKKEHIKNSLFKEEVAVIKNEQVLKNLPVGKLVGIGTWSAAHSLLSISNGKDIVYKVFNNLDSFNEIKKDIHCDSTLIINSIVGSYSGTIETSMLTKIHPEYDSFVRITGLLVEDTSKQKYIDKVWMNGEDLIELVSDHGTYIRTINQYLDKNPHIKKDEIPINTLLNTVTLLEKYNLDVPVELLYFTYQLNSDTISIKNKKLSSTIEFIQKLLQKNQANEALFFVNKALIYYPDNTALHGQKSQILGVLGKLEEALLSAQKATKLSPENTNQKVQLVDILQKLNRPKEALSVIDEAIQINPKVAGLYGRKSYVLEQMGEDFYGDALKMAQLATRLAPDNINQKIQLSNILQKIGKYDEAISIIDDALTLAPNNSGLEEHKKRLIKKKTLNDKEET